MEDFGLVFVSLQSHPGGSEAAFEADERHFFCQGRKRAGENAACHALALPFSILCPDEAIPSQLHWAMSLLGKLSAQLVARIGFLYGAYRYHLGLIVTSVGQRALSATGEPNTTGDRVDGGAKGTSRIPACLPADLRAPESLRSLGLHL